MSRTVLIMRNKDGRGCTVVQCNDLHWEFPTIGHAEERGERLIVEGSDKFGGYFTMEVQHFLGMMIGKLGEDVVRVEGKYGSRAEERAEKQPHFILLAQDNLAPELVANWIDRAKEVGASPEKLHRARKYLLDMEEWRAKNPIECKYPD